LLTVPLKSDADHHHHLTVIIRDLLVARSHELKWSKHGIKYSFNHWAWPETQSNFVYKNGRSQKARAHGRDLNFWNEGLTVRPDVWELTSKTTARGRNCNRP